MGFVFNGLILVGATFVVLTSHGDTLVTELELSKKLKLYESIRVLDVTFSQTKTIKDLDVQLKSEGRFKIIRPEKVVWEITKPSPLQVTLDKNEVKIRSGTGSTNRTEVVKLGESLSDDAARSLTGLIAWLNLDAKGLFKQYVIHHLGRDTFLFEPREKKNVPFRNLEMTIADSGHLRHLLIHEVSGDSLDIEFGVPKISSDNQ